MGIRVPPDSTGKIVETITLVDHRQVFIVGGAAAVAEQATVKNTAPAATDYGITARVARMGVELTRKHGIKVGFLRLVVAWPFPEQRIRELAGQIKAFVVPEINYGQMVLEVERCAGGKANTILVPHGGGGVHEPGVISEAIVGAAK